MTNLKLLKRESERAHIAFELHIRNINSVKKENGAWAIDKACEYCFGKFLA